MQSFELQVYKAGKWEFDSYFDDRETALFEASRLHDNDRYNGIRVLEEVFRDDSDTSDCSVIFSRLKKFENEVGAGAGAGAGAGGGGGGGGGGGAVDPRTQASREAYRMAVREVTKPDREHKGAARNSRKSKTRKKANARAGNKSRRSSGSGSHTSLNTLMIMAVVLLVVGIGSMVALRYMAAFI